MILFRLLYNPGEAKQAHVGAGAHSKAIPKCNLTIYKIYETEQFIKPSQLVWALYIWGMSVAKV